MSMPTEFDPTWYPLVDESTEMDAEQVNDSVVVIQQIIAGLPEHIRDTVVAALEAGVHTGVTVTGNDGADRIDIAVAAEFIQDTVGAMFSGNTETGITATYQDGDGTIDLEVSGSADAEFIQDTVGAMFSGNTETGVTVTYQDGDGTIDVELGDHASSHEAGGSDELTPAGIAAAPAAVSTKSAAYSGSPWDVTGVSTVHVTAGDTSTNVTLSWPASPVVHAVTFIIEQDGSGGADFTFAAGQVDVWPYGEPPIIDLAADAQTVFTLFTVDAGTTVHGIHGHHMRRAEWSFPPGEATVDEAVSNWKRIPRPHRLINTWVDATTAPTGSGETFDILRESTSVLDTLTSLGVGLTEGVANADFDTPAGATDDRYKAQVKSVGSSTPSEGVTVVLEYLEG